MTISFANPLQLIIIIQIFDAAMSELVTARSPCRDSKPGPTERGAGVITPL